MKLINDTIKIEWKNEIKTITDALQLYLNFNIDDMSKRDIEQIRRLINNLEILYMLW